MTTMTRPDIAGVSRIFTGPPDLTSHTARYGPLPSAGRLLAEVDHAGLTGRGGAAFPTARKLTAVAAGEGAKVAVANGTEGEPLSAKDKTLMIHAPHLVLDGLELAARVVGADRTVICIEAGNASVRTSLRAALAERRDSRTEIVTTPRRYVSGQETALVDLLNGGPGRPTLNRPFERGVAGRPTLVDNVETLAHLALIARFGSAWYRSAGTPDQPGTSLVTVAGAVDRPGVREVAGGASLAGLLAATEAVNPRGVLIGGYYGTWLPAAAIAGTRLDSRPLGAGVVAVIDQSSCAVAELARVAEWFAASSAGQCGACTWSLRDLAGATVALQAGRQGHGPAADIHRWTAMVAGRGACRLPDGAARFLESGLDIFAAEIADHAAGRCRRVDNHLLPTPTPEAWS